jgi:hypothetical protein
LSTENIVVQLTCKRGSASVTLSGAPVGCLLLQKISAEDAARGQTMGSRFWGPDCSLHNICSPVDERVSVHSPNYINMVRLYLRERVHTASRSSLLTDRRCTPGKHCEMRMLSETITGGTSDQVLKGSHQLFLFPQGNISTDII